MCVHTVYTQGFYIVQISVPHCVAFLFNLKLWKKIEITQSRTKIQEESSDTSANNMVVNQHILLKLFSSIFRRCKENNANNNCSCSGKDMLQSLKAQTNSARAIFLVISHNFLSRFSYFNEFCFSDFRRWKDENAKSSWSYRSKGTLQLRKHNQSVILSPPKFCPQICR